MRLGGVVSTFHVYVRVVALSAASLAVTANVCDVCVASRRSLRVELQVAGDPSSVDVTALPASAVYVNVGATSFEGSAGWVSSESVGAAVSYRISTGSEVLASLGAHPVAVVAVGEHVGIDERRRRGEPCRTLATEAAEPRAAAIAAGERRRRRPQEVVAR